LTIKQTDALPGGYCDGWPASWITADHIVAQFHIYV